MKTILLISKNIDLNQKINKLEKYKVNIYFNMYSAYNYLITNGKPDLILLEYENGDFYQNFNILKSLLITTPIISLFETFDYHNIEFSLKYGAIDYFVSEKDKLDDLNLKITKIKYSNKKDSSIYNPIIFNDNSLKVKIYDEEVELTKNEYEILKLLFIIQGEVISREKIVEKIWNIDYALQSRTVDTHIKTIRKKLNKLKNNILHINTKYSQGYYLIIKK